jgi:molybdopterin converting factor small subunit
MAIKVLIPTPLQKLTNGKPEIELSNIPCCAAFKTETTSLNTNAGNISGLIDELDAQYSGFKERICDENGKIRRFINIYVNGEDIRFLQGENTKVEDGAEVSIVPAIAGG